MKSKGLTLIEIIVSITLIFAIAVVTLGFFIYCTRFITVPGLRLAAANFDREVLENKYMKNYADLALGGAYTDFPLPTGASFAGRLGNPPYGGTRKYWITDTGHGYRAIKVTTEWSY